MENTANSVASHMIVKLCVAFFSYLYLKKFKKSHTSTYVWTVPALVYLCERWMCAMKEDFFCAMVDIDIFVEVERIKRKESACMAACFRQGGGPVWKHFNWQTSKLKCATYNCSRSQIYNHHYRGCNNTFSGGGRIYQDTKNWILRERYNVSKEDNFSNGKVKVTWAVGVNSHS